MSSKILSIIIPTYNMEKYLAYCLDSFLIEKNREKLEVLIVNDGSKDGSLNIAKDYESRYPGVFKIIDKKNGNYGSCINAALPVASGKYVKVVDADDSVNTENLDEFISFLCDNDVDLAVSDFVLVDEDRVAFKYEVYNFGKSTFAMKDICVNDRFKEMEMHAVTYRCEMLLKSRYRQTEGISYTDQQWIFAPMAEVKTVGVFNKTVYKYLVGRAGQTVDPVVKIKKMSDRTKFVQDMIVYYERLIKVVTPEIKSYLDARICPNIKDIYVTYFSNKSSINSDLIHDFDSSFKKHSSTLYNDIEGANKYIKVWRRLSSCSFAENLFCKAFTLMLQRKIKGNYDER